MNDDTYEEVVTFRLSRLSVYIGLSTVFVVLVGLTVALIVFTPLKYYIPGYGSAKVGREYRQLKYVTDSLEQQVTYQAQYIDQIKKVLSGDVETKLDTTQLQVPKDEYSND
jgi:ABC-type dipeptide/oligopeptide/nickel transport system permease component